MIYTRLIAVTPTILNVKSKKIIIYKIYENIAGK
jgi:hypothetical protein